MRIVIGSGIICFPKQFFRPIQATHHKEQTKKLILFGKIILHLK